MNKKEYFINSNGRKEGAYTLEELLSKDIYDNALIWKAGWDDWKNALEVDEIKDYVILTPPPTKEEIKIVDRNRYFSKYIKEFKDTFLSFIVTTSIISVFWNIYFFNYAKMGGTYEHPIYLTIEERANPSLIFWNHLPSNLFLVFIICFVVWVVIVYFRVNKNSNIKVKDKPLKKSVSEVTNDNILIFSILLSIIFFIIIFLFAIESGV